MSREIAELCLGHPGDPQKIVFRVLRDRDYTGRFSLIEAERDWIAKSIATGKPISWGMSGEIDDLTPIELGSLLVSRIQKGLTPAEMVLTDQQGGPSKRILLASGDKFSPGLFTLEVPHPDKLAESTKTKQPVSWEEATKMYGLTPEALGAIIGFEVLQRSKVLEANFYNRLKAKQASQLV